MPRNAPIFVHRLCVVLKPVRQTERRKMEIWEK
jgi:hypothetical protein